MCGISLVVENVEDAEDGHLYRVGTVRGDNSKIYGVVHPNTKPPSDCVICVKDKTEVLLMDVPSGLQSKYGIRDQAVATFYEREWPKEDVLLLHDTAQLIPLSGFGSGGVRIHIGVPIERAVPDLGRAA